MALWCKRGMPEHMRLVCACPSCSQAALAARLSVQEFGHCSSPPKANSWVGMRRVLGNVHACCPPHNVCCALQGVRCLRSALLTTKCSHGILAPLEKAYL
eukprot:scaffold218051_cov15-Tisochrysis_lutea.AAC.1